MQQAAGESPQQQLSPRPLPCDLANKAYALVPCHGDFASWLEQQEATITYLSVWLGDGQPVTFYSPPERYFPHGVCHNCTLGECTRLPWIVNRFYVRRLDRNYRKNRTIRRALEAINAQTSYLDGHPELEDHPDDARAPHPDTGPSS
jgi:hypothetical protein